MSRRRKLTLAVVTAWPLLYMVLFIGWIVWAFASSAAGDDALPGFGVVFGLHIATMLLILGLTIFYVLHALRSGRVPPNERLLWVVILFVGNAIAMPIYWWLYVWKEPEPAVQWQQGPPAVPQQR